MRWPGSATWVGRNQFFGDGGGGGGGDVTYVLGRHIQEPNILAGYFDLTEGCQPRKKVKKSHLCGKRVRASERADVLGHSGDHPRTFVRC